MLYLYYTYNKEFVIMLAVRLPIDLDEKLTNLSKETARPKSYYVRQAIKEFLIDHEDYLLAVARLEKNNPRISLEEMEKRFDLED